MSGLDVSERGYRSIGEVLAEVQDEFPEITISKIRFLESQGLIDPERTASGYRKFYPRDVERLRFILRSQKDAYLPLKVIRDRLIQTEIPAASDVSAIARPAVPESSAVPPNTAPSPVAAAVPGFLSAADAPVSAHTPAVSANPQPVLSGERLPIWMKDHSSAPGVAVAPPARLASLDGGISMNFGELAQAANLTDTQLREIESFGLICPTVIGRDKIYDEEALLVTKLVAAFLEQGLEPRHLRMYRTSADREAGLFEQVAVPLIKQRNPQARAEAQRRLETLSTLGEQMRAALLRQSLRPYTTGGGGVA